VGEEAPNGNSDRGNRDSHVCICGVVDAAGFWVVTPADLCQAARKFKNNFAGPDNPIQSSALYPRLRGGGQKSICVS
jgi:hypothetical protein